MFDRVHRNKYVQGMSNVRSGPGGKAEARARTARADRRARPARRGPGGDPARLGAPLRRRDPAPRRFRLPPLLGERRAPGARDGRADRSRASRPPRRRERVRAEATAVAPGSSESMAPGASGPSDPSPRPEAARAELLSALERFDGEAAEHAIDRAIGSLSTEAFLSELALPVLRDLGDRLGPRSGRRQRGALRQLAAPRPPARPRPRMGRRERAPCAPRLPVRGSATTSG